MRRMPDAEERKGLGEYSVILALLVARGDHGPALHR